MKRVIIAGSRGFDNYAFLEGRMDLLSEDWDEDLIVVSGGARGADKLGEQWAFRARHDVEVIPADWERHGRAAGPIRNEEMADIADAVVVFWDGISRGSKSMISAAVTRALELHVYIVEGMRA